VLLGATHSHARLSDASLLSAEDAVAVLQGTTQSKHWECMQVVPKMNRIVAGLRGVKQMGAETPELQKFIAWLGKLQNRSLSVGITEDENRELGFVTQSLLDRLKAAMR
jgi:hypothetical protein